MDDFEIRLRCIDAAVRTVGNPNHIQQARDYYNFATEGNEAPEATANPAKANTKGSRK